ncbi:MAG: hypothetical protein E7413_03020 [Ruminococcaceae bacterium]|nr:hypothetical protein [Oscillospiraceae bacterium]
MSEFPIDSKTEAKLIQLERELDYYNQVLLTETDYKRKLSLQKKITKINDEIAGLKINTIPYRQRSRADRMYLENKKYKMFLLCTLAVLLLLAVICLLTALRYNQMKGTYSNTAYQADQYKQEIDELNNQLEETAQSSSQTATPEPTLEPAPEPTVDPTPEPTQSSPSTSNTGGGLYYVQTIQGGKRVQIGAFKVYDNASDLAYENRYNGYKVYDENGNCVYDPYPTASQLSPETGSSLYYVQKIEYGKRLQIGAFKIYDNATKLAYEHRHEGYKVYDYDGNCVYDPGY